MPKYITRRDAATMLRVSPSQVSRLLGNAQRKSKMNRCVIALYLYSDVKALQESRSVDRKVDNRSRNRTKAPRHYKHYIRPEDDPYGTQIPIKWQKRPCPDCGARLREGQYKCQDCTPNNTTMSLDESLAYGEVNL